MKRFLLIIILLLTIVNLSFAGLPTQEQVEKYCIQVRLKIDGDIHHYCMAFIVSFNEEGLKVKYGRYLEKINFILREDILNFEEAFEKYKRLGGK